MADVILRFFQAVNDHDLDAIEACYHDDYVSEQPCFPSRRFTGPKAVRKVYETMYPRIKGVRYDIISHSFTELPNGTTVGFVEVNLTDEEQQNNVKGVFRMEADHGKIRSGRLYMTPVQEDAGNIDAYVNRMATPKELRK